jgi:hypothetical protein
MQESAGISRSEVKKAVDSIGLPDRKGAYAIHGSGSLMARGLIPSGHDLDIVVSPEVFKELEEKHPDKVDKAPSGSSRVLFHHGPVEVEVFKDWWGTTSEEVIRNAERIDGVWYASLYDVEEWKKRRNKPKDQVHLELIKKWKEVTTRTHDGTFLKSFSDKESMINKLAAVLDNIANSLEFKGLMKEATELDIISNTLEAAYDPKSMTFELDELTDE